MRLSVSSPGYTRPEANCVRAAMGKTEVVENVSALPFAIASLSITTSGRPFMVVVSGDANPAGANTWCRMAIFRNIGSGDVRMSSLVQLESNGSNENVPFSLHFLDTGIASLSGTNVTYSLCITTIYSVWEFGEAEGPDISIFEI